MKRLTLLVKPAAGLCNMNCGYCFYRAASDSRKNEVMSSETVDELIRKIAAFGPAKLAVLFQGGEPTLAGLGFFQNFVCRVKESVLCPVSFSLQTNGVLIDDSWAAFFRKHNFLIGVSLDGNRRINDRYRRDKYGVSVLPQVLSAISVLRKHRVHFNILSVIDDENAADIESTWKYFKKHGFRFLQFIPYVDDVPGVTLSPEKYEDFLKKSFDLWYGELLREEYVSVRHIDNYVGVLMGRSPESCAMCGVCGSYFVVEANGDIFPCDFYCKDEDRLGSVYDDQPFAENEKQRRFVEESKIIHEQCEKCRYYVLCRGGCKRNRTDGFTKNKYCEAYYGFFEYAAERMERAAEVFLHG